MSLLQCLKNPFVGVCRGRDFNTCSFDCSGGALRTLRRAALDYDQRPAVLKDRRILVPCAWGLEKRKESTQPQAP